MPFKSDLEKREKASRKTFSIKIRQRGNRRHGSDRSGSSISLNLQIPKDKHTFKLSQPNAFKRDSDKEFFVLHHKPPANSLKNWSVREKILSDQSQENLKAYAYGVLHPTKPDLHHVDVAKYLD